MPSWMLIAVGAILVYVALCLLLDDWIGNFIIKHKYFSIPLSILTSPILMFVLILENLKKSKQKKAEEKQTIELPYKISESTIRRIGQEGITYRDKD